MKTIVEAIQTALQAAEELSYVRSSDVFLSPVENYVPESVKEHAIGIAPGTENRTEKMGGYFDVKLTVKVVLWIALLKPESAVVGTRNEKGILDFTDDVDTVLDQNFLNIPGMESAFCQTFAEPVPFGSKKQQGRFLVKRTLTYEYEMEAER